MTDALELDRRLTDAREHVHAMLEVGYGPTVDSDLHRLLAVLDGGTCEDCPICGEDHQGDVPMGCETGDGV